MEEDVLDALIDYCIEDELDMLLVIWDGVKIDTDLLKETITPERARYLSDILFIVRDKLKTNRFATNLFVQLNLYYDSKYPSGYPVLDI